MESYHWFLLGVMVAFTPSLVVLGVMLARPVDQSADTSSPESEPYWGRLHGCVSAVAIRNKNWSSRARGLSQSWLPIQHRL